MTDTQPREAVMAEVAAAARFKWLALASLGLAVAALVVAFIPFGAIPAGMLALAGLVVGVICLFRDPGFSLLALGGTVLSSAAVGVAVIMAIAGLVA